MELPDIGKQLSKVLETFHFSLFFNGITLTLTYLSVCLSIYCTVALGHTHTQKQKQQQQTGFITVDIEKNMQSFEILI